MKQLFLKTLLWTIQNGGKALVALIQAINSRLAQLFWTPFFAYAAYEAMIQGGWRLIWTVLFAYMAGRSAFKLFARSAEPTTDTRQDDATQARDEAAEALKAEALEIASKPRATTIVEVDGIPTITPVRIRKPKGGAK